MAKSYDQYCPIAHALDLVGERWSLLVVRELLHDGPLRYSDLHARLDGCGTNILAARLKTLEQGGVVRRRRLEPPAASWVYELTEYGEGLREVLHVLAHWGARSLRPPATTGDLEPGWLPGALRIALPATCRTSGSSFESVTSSRQRTTGRSSRAPSTSPTRPSSATAAFYRLLVDRDLDAVEVEGDRGRRALDARIAAPGAARRPALDEAAGVAPRPRLELDPALAAELAHGVEDDAPAPVHPAAEEVDHRDAVGNVAADVEREDDGRRVDTTAVALR